MWNTCLYKGHIFHLCECSCHHHLRNFVWSYECWCQDLFSNDDGNRIKSAIIYGIVLNTRMWIIYVISVVAIYLSYSIWERVRKRRNVLEWERNTNEGDGKISRVVIIIILLLYYFFLQFNIEWCNEKRV